MATPRLKCTLRGVWMTLRPVATAVLQGSRTLFTDFALWDYENTTSAARGEAYAGFRGVA